jgi:hypothetical protein
MQPPGAHQLAAFKTLREELTDEAPVHAMLAIASAINRLADAVIGFVATQQQQPSAERTSSS